MRPNALYGSKVLRANALSPCSLNKDEKEASLVGAAVEVKVPLVGAAVEAKAAPSARPSPQEGKHARGGAGSVAADRARSDPKTPRMRGKADADARRGHAPKDKGRPGRKPARKPVQCHNCRQVGHVQAACPVRGGLRLEPPVEPRALEGRNVEQVLAILEPEHVNPVAGDDPRVEMKAAVVEEIKVDKLPLVEANLYNKAVTMLLTKDLRSRADKKIVLQSLVMLARKEKYHELAEESEVELMNIYSRAVKAAFDQRLRMAKGLTQSRVADKDVELDWQQAFGRGLGGLPSKFDNWDQQLVNKKPDLDQLEFYEETSYFSLQSYELSRANLRWFKMGQVVRLIFSLIAEKLLFVMLWALIAAPGNPIAVWLWSFPEYPSYGVAPDGSKVIAACPGDTSVALADCFRKTQHLMGDYCGTDFMFGACVDNYRSELKAHAQVALCAAVVIGWFILLVVETRAVWVMKESFFTKVLDLLLRTGFHTIDAVSTTFCFMAWSSTYSFLNGSKDYIVVDAINTIVWLMNIFHLIWNSLCIFRWLTPHRCFSLVEAARILYDTCLEDENMKSPAVQRDFEMEQSDVHCKPKPSIAQYWGIRGILPTVFSNCSHNEKISMDGRVGKQLPMHKNQNLHSVVTKYWYRSIGALAGLIELIPRSEGKMDFYEWAATFPPNRRRELIDTYRHCNDMPQLNAKSFIKREIALKDELDVVFKDPRFIQGCPLELSAAVGPTLRPWTKLVRDSIGPFGFTPAEVRSGKHIIYTCGLSNEEIGRCYGKAIEVITEMAEDDEVVFLEDDQSRFDLHLTKGPFSFLRKVYSTKLPRRQANLLKRGVSRGTSILGTRYQIPYTMQSGWPDTSVGDTLVNAAMKTLIHGSGRPWISIICGDDSVTVTTASEIRRLGYTDGITAAYAKFGMEVEAKVTDDPLLAEFCSGRFYPIGTGYTLFPKPGRILAKIFCDMKQRQPKDQLAWCRGIVSTLETYARVDPLLAALGAAIRRQIGMGREVHDSGWEHKQFMDGSCQSSKHDVLTYYDLHYGLCEQQVASATACLSRARLGELSEDSVLRVIAEVDIA